MATTTRDLVTVAGHRLTVGSPDPLAESQNAAAQAMHNYLVTQGMTPEQAQTQVSNIAGAQAAAAANPAPTTFAGNMPVENPADMLSTSALDRLIHGDTSTLNGTDFALPGANGAAPAGSDIPPSGSTAVLQDWLRAHGYGALGGGASPAGPSGAGVAATPPLNVPFGSAYYQPVMTLLGQLLLAGNANKQDNIKTLAGLQANPHSASELAFLRSGLGLDPFSSGGNALDVQRLINDPSSNGGAQSTVNIGGKTVTVPNTLSGSQLHDLAGDPNGQGVIESLATSAGNPDIIARSKAALMPGLFGQGALGYGSQAPATFGAGTGI